MIRDSTIGGPAETGSRGLVGAGGGVIITGCCGAGGMGFSYIIFRSIIG